MVRGRGSIYGDAWDYIANPEGITRFWRDGLTRNKDFENVITLGMRGENDTAIMQHATLEENIQLIRNVLKTQNQLIREIINPGCQAGAAADRFLLRNRRVLLRQQGNARPNR